MPRFATTPEWDFTSDGKIAGGFNNEAGYYVLDPETGELEGFDVPVPKGDGAQLMRPHAGCDGNIYIGIYPTLHISRYQPRAERMVDLGKIGPRSGEGASPLSTSPYFST